MTRTCILEADGKRILSLQTRKGQHSKKEVKDFKSFSVKGKTILETTMHTSRLIWKSRATDSASLELGDHPIAEELRDLEIDWKLLRAFHAPTMKSIVDAPREIATLN